ncbi:MAG: GNAT family N-acetyltransferase [Bacteroidota bacterium]
MEGLDFRKALQSDVPHIIKMLADDALGAKRERYENPLPQVYYDAFEIIDKDPNHELTVVEDKGEIVGTLQLSFLPYLTYQGGWRAQIEAVRISSSRRGQGLGQIMFEWAIARAKARGAHLLQLTTDKARPEALKFYEKLGFKASHEGMKLHF